MGRFVAPRPFLSRLRRATASRAGAPASPPPVVPLARRGAGPALTAAAALTLAAAPAWGQVPRGGELRVNTYTTGTQQTPSVGVDADGGFVVVWEGPGQGDVLGIYAQRYSAGGAAVGPELLVNTYTTGSQQNASVSLDADGAFVVAWQGPGPGDTYGVFARRFSAAGVALDAAEVLVNTYTTGSQQNASVSLDADGDYVVAWWGAGAGDTGGGVFARRFSAAGVALDAAEVLVNTYTTGTQQTPSVGVDADGGFVVVWEGPGQGDVLGIYAQRYSAGGAAVGPELLVNTYTTGSQQNASVSLDADGAFVVAWQGPGPGDTYGVFARRFSAAGVALDAAEVLVNTYTTGSQQNASVSLDADGDYVVAWWGAGAGDTGGGVFARRFSAAGVALDAAEVLANTYTTGNQQNASVSLDADGAFVVAWESQNQDGSGYGVYARRYAAGGAAPAGEARVNTYTTSNQFEPAVAADADGDYVVAWHGAGTGDPDGVFAQRYTAGGTALGAEFRVNSYTTSAQVRPAVAMDADGDFVVAWSSYQQDGGGYGVYAQRYNAAGAAQGAEFRVNTYLTGPQHTATVAMAAAGAFVVAWTGQGADDANGVAAQRYSAGGVPQGGEFRVNTYTTGPQSAPAVSADASGRFVVAWTSDGQDGSQAGVYAQRYTATGAADGAEFRVNSYTADAQFEPTVGVDADGDFVVAWSSLGQDGSSTGIHAQRFTAAGAAAGAELLVNTYTPGTQHLAAVAVDADGYFVVAWQSDGQDGAGYGVFAQRFDAAGATLGGEFRANAYTTGAQRMPAVAGAANGALVVAWESGGQDGAGYGVYSRLYEGTNRPVVDPAPLGPDVRVNTYTTGSQIRPSVGVGDDGDFVVAWDGPGEGDGHGVFARRYGADGVPLDAAAFRVNGHTTGLQLAPSVGVDAEGDFVVVWYGRGPGETTDYGIFVRRYSAAGVSQGAELLVNTYTTGNQYSPSVGVDADGDFVVAWYGPGTGDTGDGVFAQRFSATGVAQGGNVLVNTYTTGTQGFPSVEVDADGDFVVVWQGRGPGETTDNGIFVRRYSAGGVAQDAAEALVNTYTTGGQNGPAVEVDADGDFVVAWWGAGAGDTGFGVFARRYSAAGVAQGAAEALMNTYTTGNQLSPSVGMDADGDFVVAWQGRGPGQTTDDGIFIRRYSAAGVAQDAAEALVNTYTTGNQRIPSVGMDADGDFVVVWDGPGTGDTDYGVFARRYPFRAVSAEMRGGEGWRMLAAPTPTATVGGLLGARWTTGFPGADRPDLAASVFRYTESATGGLTAGYVPPAAASEVMGAGRGYFAYVWADDDYNAGGLQGGFPKALFVTGDEPAGPVALPVSYTDTADPDAVDGWNLVGNPYRTSIDWDLVVRADVSAAVYVWDPLAASYRTWNSVAGDLNEGHVTAYQGMWAKAMDADLSGTVVPSASVPTSAKVGGGGEFYGLTAAPATSETEAAAAPVIALSLTRGEGGTGREARAFVAFAEGGAAGLDALDAYQLTPPAPDYTALYTSGSDGTPYAVQALPLAEGAYALPLGGTAVEGGAPVGGAFTLTWDAAPLPDGWAARLVDAQTGESRDLTAAGTYAFTLAAPTARAGQEAAEEVETLAGPPAPRVLEVDASLTGGRFTVVVEATAVATEPGAALELALSVAPNPARGSAAVRFALPTSGRVRVAVYDVLGREVAVLADAETAAGRHEVALAAGQLAPGVYLVRLEAGDEALVRRVTVVR